MSDTISIKASFNNEQTLFPLNESLSFSELCCKLKQTFPLLYSTPFFVGYFDDEQEFIRITSTLEIKEAISLMEGNTIRLYITTSLEGDLPKPMVEVQKPSTTPVTNPISTNTLTTSPSAQSPLIQPNTTQSTQEILPKLVSTLVEGSKAVTNFMTNFLVPVFTPAQNTYEDEINQLSACGFEDREKNLVLLRKHGGNINTVLDSLLKV
eukprot:TRINITY_DN464_c0_g4_i1.p1 TRINITY_DN464_c0_g4~~TRINITY_DN464_c0_g4_i1.p1  ORF type:complete len:209 (-),score=46.96 TRINITY_DN464_c0_g4_i1:118-744(-)